MKRLGLAALALLAVVRPAASSCGTTSCPIDFFGRETAPARSLKVGYEFEYVDQDRPWLYGEPGAVGQPSGHHDEVYTVSRVHRLTAAAGLTRRLGLELAVPYVSRTHAHIHHHGGQDIRDAWDLSGWGDATARLRWVLRPGSPGRGEWSLVAGVEAPTGRRHFRNDAAAAAEVGILPGSGSWDALGGVAWHRMDMRDALLGGMGERALFWSALYRSNGPGAEEYRLGDSFEAHAGGVYPLSRLLGASLSADVLVKRKDWKGETREETDKTGGEYVFLSPGLAFHPGHDWDLTAVLQLPVYRRVDRLQITADWGLVAGVSRRFRY